MKFPYFKLFLITILISSRECGLADAIICLFLKTSYMLMIAVAQSTGQLDQDMVDKVLRSCGPQATFGPLSFNLVALYHLRKDAGDIADKLFNVKFDFKKTLLDKEELIFSNKLIVISSKISVTSTTSFDSNKDAIITVKAGEVTDKDGAKVSAAAESLSDKFIKQLKDATGFDLKEMSLSLEKSLSPLNDGTIKVKASPDGLDLTYSTTKEVKGATKITEDITYHIERNPQTKAEVVQAVDSVIEKAKSAFKQVTEDHNLKPIPVFLAGAATLGLIAMRAHPAGMVAATALSLIGPVTRLVGMPAGVI